MRISNSFALKIVEIDAFDLGYGGILKQKKEKKKKGINCCLASKHCNHAQQNYSTIKK